MTAKHVATKLLTLKSVIVPGSFELSRRLSDDRVRTLATSLTNHGQIAPLVVRQRGHGYELWAGGDRYAAAVLAELERVEAKVYEGTDREMLELQLVENAFRRHSDEERVAARQRLIDLYSAEVEQENLPPEKAMAEVVARVASATGVHPETVKRAERRRRRKQNHSAFRPASSIPKDINTLGIEMSTEWADWARRVQDPLRTATEHMQRAQVAVGRAAKTLQVAPEKAAEMLRLHDDLHAVLVRLRGSVPVSVCPYCKALDGALDACPACLGTAVISDAQLKQCPPDLLETGKHARIVHGGRQWLVSEWEASHPSSAAEPAKAAPDRADWGDL